VENFEVSSNIVIQTPTASNIVIQGAIMMQCVTQTTTVVALDRSDDYKFSISLWLYICKHSHYDFHKI